MALSLILAAARNGVIGGNNQLLWHLPNDFRFFKNTTKGHPIIMGRKTFESIGKALPDRTNIIVTRDRSFAAPGCEVFTELDKAIHYARTLDEDVFVIGGAEIFRQTMSEATRIYYTEVDADLEGDAVFPPLNENVWDLVWSEAHKADEKHRYNYTFKVFDRNSAL